MKIYHNPRCSKSRQTLQFIEEKGAAVEIVKYLEDIPSESELKSILKALGIEAKALLRKGEADFKEHFKGKDLSEDEWIKAMIQYPKMIDYRLTLVLISYPKVVYQFLFVAMQ